MNETATAYRTRWTPVSKIARQPHQSGTQCKTQKNQAHRARAPKATQKRCAENTTGARKNASIYQLFTETQQQGINYTELLRGKCANIENANAGPTRQDNPERNLYPWGPKPNSLELQKQDARPREPMPTNLNKSGYATAGTPRRANRNTYEPYRTKKWNRNTRKNYACSSTQGPKRMENQNNGTLALGEVQNTMPDIQFLDPEEHRCHILEKAKILAPRVSHQTLPLF